MNLLNETDLLFDCSRVLEYAKIRTVLHSNETRNRSGHYSWDIFAKQTVGANHVIRLGRWDTFNDNIGHKSTD